MGGRLSSSAEAAGTVAVTGESESMGSVGAAWTG